MRNWLFIISTSQISQWLFRRSKKSKKVRLVVRLCSGTHQSWLKKYLKRLWSPWLMKLSEKSTLQNSWLLWWMYQALTLKTLSNSSSTIVFTRENQKRRVCTILHSSSTLNLRKPMSLSLSLWWRSRKRSRVTPFSSKLTTLWTYASKKKDILRKISTIRDWKYLWMRLKLIQSSQRSNLWKKLRSFCTVFCYFMTKLWNWHSSVMILIWLSSMLTSHMIRKSGRSCGWRLLNICSKPREEMDVNMELIAKKLMLPKLLKLSESTQSWKLTICFHFSQKRLK